MHTHTYTYIGLQAGGPSGSSGVVHRPGSEGRIIYTCHNLPPSEIDLGLCWAVFAGSGGKYSFHRIG